MFILAYIYIFVFLCPRFNISMSSSMNTSSELECEKIPSYESTKN